MRFRTTGVLLVIFVLLAGYVYFFELHKKPPETPVDKSTWVLTLSKDDVQQLTVTDKSGSVALARGDNGAWFIGSVGGDEADATRVGTIVDSLVDLRAARTLTQTAESLATYGLENPAVTVTLGLSDNRQEVLYIGDKNVQGTSYYVQHKGQSPVYLVYASLIEDLQKLITNPPYKPTPTAQPSPSVSPATVAPSSPTLTP